MRDVGPVAASADRGQVAAASCRLDDGESTRNQDGSATPQPLIHWHYIGSATACTNPSVTAAALAAPAHDAEYTIISAALAATNPPVVLFEADWLATLAPFGETTLLTAAQLAAAPGRPLSTHDGGLSLFGLAPAPARLLSVSYLAAAVVASNYAAAVLAGGSDDGISVWHNGRHIYSSPERIRGLYQADRIPVTLVPGTNVFLFKLLQGHAGWALCYWLCPPQFFHERDRFPEGCVEAMHRQVIEMDAHVARACDTAESFRRGAISRAFVGKYVNDIIDSGRYDDGIRMLRELTRSLSNQPNSHSIAAYGLRTLLVKRAERRAALPLCGLKALESAAHAVRHSGGVLTPLPVTNATLVAPGLPPASVFARSPSAAYAQTAAAWPGLGLAPLAIFQHYPPASSNGYSVAELTRLATQAGLAAVPVRIDYPLLCATASNTVPAICFWPAAGTNLPGHFVTVVRASTSAVALAAADFDTWDEYREPMKFEWRWDGVALFVCASNMLADSPAVRAAWDALRPYALPPEAAAALIGGADEDQPVYCTNNFVCATDEETGGTGGAGAGAGLSSLSCSSCAAGGVFPSFSINRHDMAMEVRLTPLSYDAGDGVHLNFTLTHRTLCEEPDRHFGHRWTLNYDLRHVLDRDRTPVARIGKSWLVDYTEPRPGRRILTERATNDFSRPVTAVRDHRGRATTFSYSANRAYVELISDPFGRVVRCAYDANGNLLLVKDPVGRAVVFSYDNSCRITAIVTPLGTNRFVYFDDSDGLTTAIEFFDALGRRTRYEWEPLAFTRRDPDGSFWRHERQMIDKDNITLARTARLYKNGCLVAATEFFPDGSPRFAATWSLGAWESTAWLRDPRGNTIASVDHFGRTEYLHPFHLSNEEIHDAGCQMPDMEPTTKSPSRQEEPVAAIGDRGESTTKTPRDLQFTTYNLQFGAAESVAAIADRGKVEAASCRLRSQNGSSTVAAASCRLDEDESTRSQDGSSTRNQDGSATHGPADAGRTKVER